MGVPELPIKASVITIDQTHLVEAELRRRRRNKILIWIGIGATLIAMLAVAVATPVVMKMTHGQHNVPTRGPSRTTAIIPLYVYPGSGAWKPLYKAVSRRPDLDFLVIVNPNNGPGASAIPDEVYAPQIKILNSYANVRTIGYVRISRALRNVTDVLGDISKYSAWAAASPKLAMNGIFFDEAPITYSDDIGAYLEQINSAAKAAVGLQGNRTIVHNPGQVSDIRLRGSQTDVQVIVENTYSGFQDPTIQAQLQDAPGDPSWYSYMVHSVPDGTEMVGLINQMTQHADYIFITDLSSTYYEEFGGTWDLFINSMLA